MTGAKEELRMKGRQSIKLRGGEEGPEVSKNKQDGEGGGRKREIVLMTTIQRGRKSERKARLLPGDEFVKRINARSHAALYALSFLLKLNTDSFRPSPFLSSS